MNRINKKIVLFSIFIIVILIFVFIFLSYQNNQNDKNIEDNNSAFLPTLFTNDVKEIKQNGEIIDESDSGIMYKVDGNYEKLNGHYEYVIDNNNEISYISFVTIPADFDIQLFYDDITQEEKNKRIEKGYKNYEKNIEYITNDLKYKPVNTYKILTDGNVEKLQQIPSVEQLKSEFVNSETISCYVIELEKNNNEKISLTISSKGWNSIVLTIMDNLQNDN